MSIQIDERAIVSPSAKIGENTVIGPFAVVGDNAEVGSNCVIDSFAQVLGFTKIGRGCRIFSYAVVGNIPQDLKYKGEETYLVVGDNNRIREFVTINPGTNKGNKTIIGNDNLLMAYSHIAHDCIVGNNNVLANSATLAGHVQIGDKVVIGGLTAVHQFCRLGDFSIVGGCSKVVQDIPPYSMCDGHPAAIRGLNIVGMKRAKFSVAKVRILKQAFRILFFENHPCSEAKKLVEDSLPESPELKNLLDFVSTSKRGLSK